MYLFKRLLQSLKTLLLLTGSFLVLACQPTDEPILRVGNNPWLGYETLHLARALDLYPENRIKLIELSASTETLRAFKQGQLDVAALTLDEVLRLSEQISDLQILLVTNISNGADKIISRPEIQSLEQLKNKRIGVEENTVSAYLLFQALEKAGLNIKDITIIPSTSNQHFSLMQSDLADAVVTFDPTGYKLQQLGYRLLLDSGQIDGKIVDVLVTRKAVFESHPKTLRLLVDNYWQALDYLKQQPDKAYSLIAPRMDISTEQLAQLYEKLILPGASENSITMTEELPGIIKEMGQFMLQQGLITKIPDDGTLLQANQ